MPADAALVRPATPVDVTAIVRLVDAAYRPYVERMGRLPGPMVADYDEVVREAETWVAESDSAIVGLLALRAEPDHLLVENVAVAESVRGTGLGRRLLGLAEDRARELGLPELRLYTHERMTENIAYYPRLGYVETGRSETSGFRRVHFTKPVLPAQP